MLNSSLILTSMVKTVLTIVLYDYYFSTIAVFPKYLFITLLTNCFSECCKPKMKTITNVIVTYAKIAARSIMKFETVKNLLMDKQTLTDIIETRLIGYMTFIK